MINNLERIDKKIKRNIALVITSSVISAGSLYLGITLMGQYSPALANSLNALVGETNAQNSPGTLSTALLGGEEKPDVSSIPQSVSAVPVGSGQPLNTSVNSNPPKPPVRDVTIVQVIKNPGQFIDQVITITAIVTGLGNDKFLLNDGTGQILVEVEDDLVSIAALNGLTIMISGELDDDLNDDDDDDSDDSDDDDD